MDSVAISSTVPVHLRARDASEATALSDDMISIGVVVLAEPPTSLGADASPALWGRPGRGGCMA
jgi:hypothetical protein